MPTPELVAHRGYTLHYPENTLVGIEAAIDAGARFVEVDVQLAADEAPVLFHDRTLERVCDAPGAIHDYTLEQLKRFRAKEFDRFGYRYAQVLIATLAELVGLLQHYPSVTAFIEIKRATIERFGLDTVLARVLPLLQPIADRAVIISFSVPVLTAARERGWRLIGAVVDRWRERRDAAIRALAPEYLFVDVDALPRWRRLRFGGSKIVVFEVADATLARQLAQRGAHMVETFAIGELRAALAAAEGAT
jgi:glycerophosphoryl diester phosphodiesterase